MYAKMNLIYIFDMDVVSLTQGIDQTIVQQPLAKKPQATSQGSSAFTSNTGVGNKKKSETNRFDQIPIKETDEETQALLANADELYDQVSARVYL